MHLQLPPSTTIKRIFRFAATLTPSAVFSFIGRCLDRHPWLIGPIAFLAFGIVGSMDYADQKAQQNTICEHRNRPAWCAK